MSSQRDAQKVRSARGASHVLQLNVPRSSTSSGLVDCHEKASQQRGSPSLSDVPDKTEADAQGIGEGSEARMRDD